MALTWNFRKEPFILDKLLEIPDLTNEPSSTWQPFQQASGLFTLDLVLTERKHEPLPELRAEYFALDNHGEPFPELDQFAESTSASETEDGALNDDLTRSEELVEDVWSLKDVISGTRKKKLVNWDNFLDRQHETPKSAYLSEAGTACFNAFLAITASDANAKSLRVVAAHEDFLRSLFELGIGKNSLFYQYDKELARFLPVTEDFGLSGISFEVQQEVIRNVMQMGSHMRQIEAFVAEPKSRPISIALSSAISTLLYAIMVKVETSKKETRSVIQVQELYSRPSCVLQLLQDIIKVIGTTHSDRETIIKLIDESQKLEMKHPWLSQLLDEILRRVSAPWISTMEVDVGLRPGSTALEVEETLSTSGVKFHDQIADINPETPLTRVEQSIAESRNCLAILRGQAADYPILNSSSNLSSSLSWQMSWEAIARIQVQADEYEHALRMAILRYSLSSTNESHRPNHSEVEDLATKAEEGSILTNLDGPDISGLALEGHPPLAESSLFQYAAAVLTADAETQENQSCLELRPPRSQSLSLSLNPFLDAQSRLLSFSTMHLLFKTHSLRNHLSIQHRFQLLSDAAFSSRLSRALFDSDQFTGEGRRATEGTTGLRLQARDTWPPASSELRLVLMGILSESYHLPSESKDYNSEDLPGNLSFAIRDLSAAELEKCKDVVNIEALDFLRLQYKAPPVLDSVIRQSCLKKYDKIFKHMLRLLRMQAVAQGLLRDVTGRNRRMDRTNQRFRIEIQQFISTLAAYSSSDAIGVEWLYFEEFISNIEASIDRGDYEGTLAMVGSLSNLHRLHEDVLDRTIKALFLDRRQAQVRDVIDSIFGLILRFAGKSTGKTDELAAGGTEEMHLEFKKQVNRLVRYLRSHGPASTAISQAYDDNRLRAVREPPFEHLLVKLDMFGYYT